MSGKLTDGTRAESRLRPVKLTSFCTELYRVTCSSVSGAPFVVYGVRAVPVTEDAGDGEGIMTARAHTQTTTQQNCHTVTIDILVFL